MIMQTDAEQRREKEGEVDEKESVAGGVESVRGMHRLRARINIISRLLTESRAEQPAGRLRISCLHLQKPPCALSKTVLHPPHDSRTQGRGARHANTVALKTGSDSIGIESRRSKRRGRVRQLERQGDGE